MERDDVVENERRPHHSFPSGEIAVISQPFNNNNNKNNSILIQTLYFHRIKSLINFDNTYNI